MLGTVVVSKCMLFKRAFTGLSIVGKFLMQTLTGLRWLYGNREEQAITGART